MVCVITIFLLRGELPPLPKLNQSLAGKRKCCIHAVMHVYMMMLAVLFSPAKLFGKFLNPRIPLCEY